MSDEGNNIFPIPDGVAVLALGLDSIVGIRIPSVIAAVAALFVVPAVVFGPSRSSEGFRLFYLVRWLD